MARRHRRRHRIAVRQSMQPAAAALVLLAVVAPAGQVRLGDAVQKACARLLTKQPGGLMEPAPGREAAENDVIEADHGHRPTVMHYPARRQVLPAHQPVMAAANRVRSASLNGVGARLTGSQRTVTTRASAATSPAAVMIVSRVVRLVVPSCSTAICTVRCRS